MERIFTDGSCFRLCKILASVCTGAEFYYSQKDGHWITKYNDRFYDINGELDQEYVVFKQYEHIVDYRTLASAYVPLQQIYRIGITGKNVFLKPS